VPLFVSTIMLRNHDCSYCLRMNKFSCFQLSINCN